MREILLTSSVLILVIALLRRLLRGRISPTLQYALWLLAAARLLIPGSLFPSPMSVMGAADDLQTVFQAAVRQDAVPSGEVQPAAPAAALPESAPLPAGESRPSIRWPLLVWGAGAGLTGVALAASNLLFAVRLRRGRRRLCLPGRAVCPSVYLVEGLASPCLFGLFRPAIYVNEAALREEHLEHILVHEQTHFRHGDHLWALLRSVCLVLYWFDPLVWLAAALSRRDCELACDDGAIRRLGEQRRLDYGETLLRMVPAGRSPADLLRTATTMTAGMRTMRERIALIANRPRRLRLTLAAVLLVMCGVVAVTFGGRAAAPEPDTPAPAGAEAEDTPSAAQPSPAVLAAAGYTHPSGLFSLTVPEAWLGEVVCIETEDGAVFYDAEAYRPGTEDGWLMSVLPQPASWAEAYNRSDYTLEGFDFSGSPYVYVLDIDQEPPLTDERYMALASQAGNLADSFRLLAGTDSFPRLVHDSYPEDMALAVAYLPYLRWSDYRDLYGEEEMFRLLEALDAFIRDSDVSWGQVHDILSNRSQNDPSIDGAYATAIQEGILWQLYEKNPQRFASVLGSVYLTDEERADVLEWLRYPLSETQGRAGSPEEFLTDAEICQLLGITPSASGVTANITDVTLRAAGDSFQFLPVGTVGVYAVSYTSDDPDVADFANVSDGTVVAIRPGQTTVRMHVESNGGQYDFACIVRCAWEDAPPDPSQPDPETVSNWQRGLFGLAFSIPAAPDQELAYDSTEGLEQAVVYALEDYARDYLEAYGSKEYNDRLSRIILESDIPASAEYGAQITVRYQIECQRDREWNGEIYPVAPQAGDHLETTFTVFSIFDLQNTIRFEAMEGQN